MASITTVSGATIPGPNLAVMRFRLRTEGVLPGISLRVSWMNVE